MTKQQIGWNLCVETENDHVMSYAARKVIDATGLTSTANIPSIVGRDMFRGTVIHHKDFGNYQDSILSKVGPQDVVVLGGAKSAADVAYACAKRGKNVTWVIRRSGAGPAAFVSAKGRGMYKNSNESFYTRLVSYFLASIFINDSRAWLERFLHRTKLGSWVLRRIWKGINDQAHKAANYGRSDGVANGFYNLKPDTEIFWQNDSTGIDLRDDFFDTVANHVKVHRADVRCFTHTGLQLDDDTVIDAQVVVFATGWRTSHPSIQTDDGTDLASQLGLSVLSNKQTTDTSTDWLHLEKTAATEILQRFPMLGSQPHYYQQASDDIAPLRLYKGMLPVEDRSIAFLGQMMLGNHFRAAEVQALYAVAALDGTLKLPSKAEMKLSIARVISWCRLRYLGKGAHGNWLYWDLVPYTDNLLDELELRSHRHKSRWKDLLSPCFATDLQGLIDEYKQKNQHVDRGNDVSDGKS